MADRTYGPIVLPESLLHALAEFRQWHVLLADADARDPMLRALELATELAPERVAEVEAELDASFSDALLGVLASRVPVLEDQYEMTLGSVATTARAAWKSGCPEDLVAVASGGRTLYCVPRREHPWASTTVTEWRRGDKEAAPQGLVRWLRDVPMREFWGQLVELGVVDPDADDPPPHGRVESGAGLVPRLAVPQAVVEATAVRVQHAKFGVGRVVRSTGSGEGRKLDIDFGGTVRTILARFVTEIG